MPFEAVQTRNTHYPKGPILLAVYPTANGGTSVQILFGAEIMEQCHWKAGDKVQLFEGTGPDENILQVKKALTGYTLTGRNDGSAQTKFLAKMLKHHKVPDEKKSLFPAEHQRFGATVLIKIHGLLVSNAQAEDEDDELSL